MGQESCYIEYPCFRVEPLMVEMYSAVRRGYSYIIIISIKGAQECVCLVAANGKREK